MAAITQTDLVALSVYRGTTDEAIEIVSRISGFDEGTAAVYKVWAVELSAGGHWNLQATVGATSTAPTTGSPTTTIELFDITVAASGATSVGTAGVTTGNIPDHMPATNKYVSYPAEDFTVADGEHVYTGDTTPGGGTGDTTHFKTNVDIFTGSSVFVPYDQALEITVFNPDGTTTVVTGNITYPGNGNAHTVYATTSNMIGQYEGSGTPPSDYAFNLFTFTSVQAPSSSNVGSFRVSDISETSFTGTAGTYTRPASTDIVQIVQKTETLLIRLEDVNDSAPTVDTNTGTPDFDITEDAGSTGDNEAGGMIVINDTDTSDETANLRVFVEADAVAGTPGAPTEASTQIAAGITEVEGRYGTFTITRSVTGEIQWSYKLDDDKADQVGSTATQERLTVRAFDLTGTASARTVSEQGITFSNASMVDATIRILTPAVSGAATATTVADDGAGLITITVGHDGTDHHGATEVVAAVNAFTYTTPGLELSATGSGTASLTATTANLTLVAGIETITVTITGANDAPVVVSGGTPQPDGTIDGGSTVAFANIAADSTDPLPAATFNIADVDSTALTLKVEASGSVSRAPETPDFSNIDTTSGGDTDGSDGDADIPADGTAVLVSSDYGVFSVSLNLAGEIEVEYVLYTALQNQNAYNQFQALGEGDSLVEKLTVYGTDGTDESTPFTYIVTIDGVNDSPTELDAASKSLVLIPGSNTAGRLGAEDPDTNDTHTFTIIGGADAALFAITPNGRDLVFVGDGSDPTATPAAGVNGRKTPGSTYEVVLSIRDAGGLTFGSLDPALAPLTTVTITEGGLYVAPSSTSPAADRRYSDDVDVNGDGILEENLDGASVEPLGTIGSAAGTGVLALEAGNNDNLLFSITGPEGSQVLNFIGTGTDIAGDFEAGRTYTIEVSRGGAGMNVEQYIIRLSNINEHTPTAPVAGGLQSPAVSNEGTYADGVETGFTFTSSDADGGDVRWKIATLNNITSADDTRFRMERVGETDVYNLVFNEATPGAGVTFDNETQGEDVFTIYVFALDSGRGSGTGTDNMTSANAVLRFDNVNEAPSFSQSSYTFPVLSAAGANSGIGSVTATDVENNPFTYSITGGPFAIDENTGSITYTGSVPLTAVGTSYTLTVTATETGAPDISATVTVTVNVLDNQDPTGLAVATSPTPLTSIDENTDLSTAGGRLVATIEVTDSDGPRAQGTIDPDGGNFGFSIVDADSGSGGPVDDASFFEFRNYTAGASNAPDTVEVWLRGNAQLDHEPDATLNIRVVAGSQSVDLAAISIGDVNENPTATPQQINLNEITHSGGYTLRIADFGISDPDAGNTADGTIATITITAVRGGSIVDNNGAVHDFAAGALAIAPANIGNYRYVPENQAATYFGNINFQVTDGSGLMLANTAVLETRVSATNEAPTAGANTISSTTGGGAQAFAVGDFLYSDPEGEPLQSITITASTFVANDGTLTYNGGAFLNVTIPVAMIGNLVFTPNATRTSGYDFTLTYTVNDGAVNSAPAILTVDVTGNNPATAVTSANVGTIAENAAIASDRKIADLTITDADGAPTGGSITDSLTLSDTTNFAFGTVTGSQPTFTVELLLRANPTGFDYEALTNGMLPVTIGVRGSSVTHTVNVTVTDVNERPVDMTITPTGGQGVTTGDAVAATITDSPITQHPAASSTSTVAGVLTGILSASDDDGDTVIFTVSHTSGASTTTTTYGTGFTHSVQGSYGTLYFNQNASGTDAGKYEFVRDEAAISRANSDVSDRFTIKATDSTADSDEVVLVFNIAGVNDQPIAYEDGADITDRSVIGMVDADDTTPTDLDAGGGNTSFELTYQDAESAGSNYAGLMIEAITYAGGTAPAFGGTGIGKVSNVNTSGTTTVQGMYGQLSMTRTDTVLVKYAVGAGVGQNILDDIAELDPGDTLTEYAVFYVSDGTKQSQAVTLTITINGVNDAPVVDVTTATGSVNENAAGSAVGAIRFTVNDPDGNDTTASFGVGDFTLFSDENGVSNADIRALFEVVSTGSGTFGIKLKSGQELNHEDQADYFIKVTANDGNGATNSVSAESARITIDVGNVDEDDATVSIARTGGSPTYANGQVYRATVVPDTDNTGLTLYTYQWYVGGVSVGARGLTTDSRDRTNEFTLTEADANKKVSVMVTYRDLGENNGAGGDVTVTVPSANQPTSGAVFAVPSSYNPGSGVATAAENSTGTVYTIGSLSGGSWALDPSGFEDTALFSLSGRVLSFTGQAPNFEGRADKTYTARIITTYTQGAATATQEHDVTVTLTNVDEGVTTGGIQDTIGLTAMLSSGTTGTPVGQIYTARVTPDPDNALAGNTSYTYVWKNGAGTTVQTTTTTDLENTFTVQSTHYNSGALTVEVTYTDMGKPSGSQSVTVSDSAGTIPAEPVSNNLATGYVSLDLTAADLIAKTVTIDTSGIMDLDGTTGGMSTTPVHKVFYSDTDPGTLDASDFASAPADGGEFTVTGNTFTFDPKAVNDHIYVQTTFKDTDGNDETIYTDLGQHSQAMADSVPDTAANALDLADLVDANGVWQSTLTAGDIDWYKFDIPAGTSADTTNITFAGKGFTSGQGFRFEFYAEQAYTGLGNQAAMGFIATGKLPGAPANPYVQRALTTGDAAVNASNNYGTAFGPNGFDNKNLSTTEGTYYLAIMSVDSAGATGLSGNGGDYQIDLDIS
jgi:VCBS repeat-containing protein